MLRMRSTIAQTGDSCLLLPHGRPFVNYSANSIVRLLGPFVQALRSRDSLAVDAMGLRAGCSEAP